MNIYHLCPKRQWDNAGWKNLTPCRDGYGSREHIMGERLAAYRRRGFLIRDRVKALGLNPGQPYAP